MQEFTEMNKIDLLSVDHQSGQAVLHLIVDGPWSDMGYKMEWIRRRLNAYGAFVVTGQLTAIEKYRGRQAKILIHCETPPPVPALVMLSEMRQYLLSQSIDIGITAGRDLETEIAFPDISGI